jgi:hypothetical protein
MHHCFDFHVHNFCVALRRPFATRYLQLQPLQSITTSSQQRPLSYSVALQQQLVASWQLHLLPLAKQLRMFTQNLSCNGRLASAKPLQQRQLHTRIEGKSSLTTSRSSNDSSKTQE